MKRSILLVTILSAAALITTGAQAIEPTYTGPYGNAEEPALRPLKWALSGVRAIGYQAKKAFIEGNMNTPYLGTVETMRGVRKGTFELIESTFKGITYAPIEKDRHKRTHVSNMYIEEDIILSEASDFAFTWGLYPLLKVVDKMPLEDDQEVEYRLDDAEDIREARREAAEEREMMAEQDILKTQDPVRKAQIDRLGHRIRFAGEDGRPPARNLLKLAK